MPTYPDQPTKPENPRTARIRVIVLRAAIQLLLNEGAEGVTALRVSEKTGIARSAIYRHWPDQQSLLLATINRIVTRNVPAITGDLPEDLTAALFHFRGRMPRIRVIFSALLAHANRNETFVEAQRHFISEVLRPIRDALTTAIERGDLSSTIDVDEAVARLAGPMFTRDIMLHTTTSDELINNAVADFLEHH